MCRALMCLILCLASHSGSLGAAEKPEHRALAEYYAPVIYQKKISGPGLHHAL